MVDKAVFINTNSAKNAMRQLEVLTNNLANAGTPGFRSDYEAMSSIAVGKENNHTTRIYSNIAQSYSDFSAGPVVNTGRDLDVAVAGSGFITVQDKTGQEAYTRAGNLDIKNGILSTQAGQVVVGTSGIITIPQNAHKISIGADGTVAAQIVGQKEMVNVGRIKLTSPAIAQLHKGDDGLFHLAAGNSAPPDEKVRLTPGSLEGSNVNPITTLTQLVELSRGFEMQANMMKTFKDDATKANQILAVPRE